MISYLALLDNTGIFLSKSSQMDEMLSNGFSIYTVDENDNKTLIATPQDGFLVEKPVIEGMGTFSFN